MLFNNEIHVQKQKQSLIFYHLFGMIITFTGLMKITSNIYGVIKNSKESMLLSFVCCEVVIRPPQKHGACRDLWVCTPHNNPVLYDPAGSEVCAGQHLSMPGCKFSLHERLPIR